MLTKWSSLGPSLSQLLLGSGATHVKLHPILYVDKQQVAGEALGVVAKLPRPHLFFQWQILTLWASSEQEHAGGQSEEPLKNILGESSSESLGSNKGETSGFVPAGTGVAFEAAGQG